MKKLLLLFIFAFGLESMVFAAPKQTTKKGKREVASAKSKASKAKHKNTNSKNKLAKKKKNTNFKNKKHGFNHILTPSNRSEA